MYSENKRNGVGTIVFENFWSKFAVFKNEKLVWWIKYVAHDGYTEYDPSEHDELEDFPFVPVIHIPLSILNPKLDNILNGLVLPISKN